MWWRHPRIDPRNGRMARIVCGTSAGSIVAAVVCVKTDAELDELLVNKGGVELVSHLTFFGLRRGMSSQVHLPW